MPAPSRRALSRRGRADIVHRRTQTGPARLQWWFGGFRELSASRRDADRGYALKAWSSRRRRSERQAGNQQKKQTVFCYRPRRALL